MEFILHCNSLSCRQTLQEQAVVTTCSHVFCLPCAENSEISAPDGHSRSCPACKSSLDKPDDVIVTNLKPTDDYKTSVLSGLSPTIIMECAGRGLAFSAYQSTQEIFYQKYTSKSLRDRLKTLQAEHKTLARLVEDQKTRFGSQIQAMGDEITHLSRANDELNRQNQVLQRERESNRTRILQVKNKQMIPDVEQAAERDAEYALQSGELSGSGGRGYYKNRAGSTGSGGQRAVNRDVKSYFGLPNKDACQGLQGSRSAHTVPGTPHRQQISTASRQNIHPTYTMTGYQSVGLDHLHVGTPRRPPLASIGPNSFARTPGYGMSAGMKEGRMSGLTSRSENVTGRPGANTGFVIR